MKMDIKDTETLKRKGIDVLYKELGPLETVCFLRLFETGIGDYTKERDVVNNSETIDSIVSRIRNSG